uniref:FLYWCH-type domain-containing protein n=1 Tax=Glossina brevipalpis TaxID=37001 RepID=A0A1A9WMM6_9MUSC
MYFIEFQPFIINKYKRRKSINAVILPMVDIEGETKIPKSTHQSKCSFVPGQRGKLLLLYQNFTYSKNNENGNTTYWKCRTIYNGKPCNARITTFKRTNGLYNVFLTNAEHNHPPSKHETTVAVYSATSRGRVQLIYGGQPFIFEKKIKLSTLEEKKYWRCNQWWNQKCRSRVCTINDTVIPLNRYHTHEEIVKRKKRVRKNLIPPATAVANDKLIKPEDGHHNVGPTTTITSTSIGSVAGTGRANLDVSSLGMHLKYEEIVADVTEIVEPSAVVISKK